MSAADQGMGNEGLGNSVATSARSTPFALALLSQEISLGHLAPRPGSL